MRKTAIIEGRRCPNCGHEQKQKKNGFNRSGTQRMVCLNCNTNYTLNPKAHAYPEEIKQSAIKVYYSGVSGRGVGKIFGMSKDNVYNWIKKTGNSVDK